MHFAVLSSTSSLSSRSENGKTFSCSKLLSNVNAAKALQHQDLMAVLTIFYFIRAIPSSLRIQLIGTCSCIEFEARQFPPHASSAISLALSPSAQTINKFQRYLRGFDRDNASRSKLVICISNQDRNRGNWRGKWMQMKKYNQTGVLLNK